MVIEVITVNFKMAISIFLLEPFLIKKKLIKRDYLYSVALEKTNKINYN